MEKKVIDYACFLTAEQCARRYNVSKRHFLNLIEKGLAPESTRLGGSVRWPLARLAEWEKNDCHPVKKELDRE